MPRESQLAERFDVSRATIGEAEIALEGLSPRDPPAASMAMREHDQRLFEAMLSATEHTAFEEIKRPVSEGRQRFFGDDAGLIAIYQRHWAGAGDSLTQY